MDLRRVLLGLVSLALILAGGVLLAIHGVNDSGTSMLAGVCLRCGVVLGAVWLALPQVVQLVARSSPWFIALYIACAVLVVWRPRLLIVIGPILMILGFLHVIGWALRADEPARRGGARRAPRKRG